MRGLHATRSFALFHIIVYVLMTVYGTINWCNMSAVRDRLLASNHDSKQTCLRHDLLPVPFVLQHEQLHIVAQSIPVIVLLQMVVLPSLPYMSYLYHRLWESTIAMTLMRSCVQVRLAFVSLEMLLSSTFHFEKLRIRAIPYKLILPHVRWANYNHIECLEFCMSV